MNILIVVTNADLAGAPIHVRDLALNLHELGHKVSVVFGEHGAVKFQLEAAGIETYILPTLRSNINPIQDIATFVKLRILSKRINPDLLHLHSSKAGLVGRLVAFSLRLPAIYTVHGWGFGPGRRRLVSNFVFATEWLCKSITSRYISVSNADRDMGLRNLQLPPEKIQTIYNATVFKPVSMPTMCRTGLRLIMVARNDQQKDYNTFFRSLALARFDQAIVVGRGTSDPDFVSWGKSLAGNNCEKINFLGIRTDVEALLEQASAMVLSSHFEGLPISIIEAMSKSLPILASQVGGISELVDHGINGFLFKAGSVGDLADYITYLYDRPDERLKMGNESLKRFERDFCLSNMIKMTLLQYEVALVDRNSKLN